MNFEWKMKAWRWWVCKFENEELMFWVTLVSSVQSSRSVVSNSLWPHELQHTPDFLVHHQLPELAQTRVHQVGDAIKPSHPLSSHSPMSQFFTWDGQSIGVSASVSVLPMNIQDWFPLGWTGWISLQSKGLSRVFSNTTVQKHQFFGAQFSFREGNGNPLQYSCLENPMDGGAW